MTTTVDAPIEPGTANRLWIAVVGLLALCLVHTQCGCTNSYHQGVHVALPTAADLQTKIGVPAAAAKASNATAMQLAVKAEKSGVAAGSADARALSLATAETDQHLVEVLAGKDRLTKQLGADQVQIDAKEKAYAESVAQVAKLTTLAAKERHEKWEAIDLLVVFALCSVMAISIMGAILQAIARAIEKAVARALLKAGATAVHAAEEIPAVAATVVKVGAVAAVL